MKQRLEMRPAVLTIACVACVACVASAAIAGERLPGKAELAADNAKNVRHPATYSAERSEWNARAIAIRQEPVTVREDYATLRYGHPWNFDDGTLQGIRGKLHVTGLGVANGVLSYTTRQNAEIFWGDHYGDRPEYGNESIGAHWTGHWNPIHLRLRIKQSLSESDWVFSMCQGQDAWMWRMKSPLKIEGTAWQTIELPFMDSRFTFRSLSFLTQQAGNEIEIDEVSLYTPRAARQYRYDFDLAEQPVAAAMCVNAAPVFTLAINGKTVVREEGSKDMSRMLYRYADLTRWFRKGRNTIQVDAELYDWWGTAQDLVVEGMARDAGGRIYPIATGESWKGRFRPADDSGAEDAWQPVKVTGSIKSGSFVGPPYYGRIEVTHPDRKCPIFPLEMPVVFDVRLFAPDLTEAFDLICRVEDALDQNAVLYESTVEHALRPGVHDTAFAWGAPRPGVYDVCFELRGQASGRVLDQRYTETAVVGPIEQAEVEGDTFDEGLGLKLVDEINCANDADPRPFISRDASGAACVSSIVSKPFGTYRQAGNAYFSYLSWKVEVVNADKPHLMEVEYPDDVTRIVNVNVGSNNGVPGDIPNDRGDRLWSRCGSGVYTGFEHPVSNTMKTLRLVYWPGDPIGSVVVASAYATPAAVAKIRVYEITEGLPALRCPSTRYRLTGMHGERLSILPATYFAGEEGAVFSEYLRLFPHRGFYKDWYQTNANLIRHMRFLGENVLVAGVHMYNTAEYPSPSYPVGWAAQADPIELMGHMFARNGLSVYMGVEYGSPPELAQSGFNVTDAQVADGTPTLRYVDRNGRQAPKSFCSSLNVFAPQVEAGLHRVVDELCDLYGNTPGILGIHLQAGESLNPGIWGDAPRLDGYPDGMAVDDLTVSQFERDTGLRVPADRIGVGRFAQRDTWLAANAREKWIDWRCRRIYGINRKMRDRMRKANSNWQLSIGLQVRTVPAGPESSFLESVRLQGYDPALYDRPGFMLQFGANPLRVRAQLEDAGLWQLGRRFNTDPEVLAAFARPGREFARWIGGGFFEPTLHAPSEGWYWASQLQIAYPLPVGRNLLDGYSSALLDGVPQVIFQHWLDLTCLAGNEHIIRRFNRAYTALPPGDYRTLTGHGFDRNLVVRATKHAFYVINPLPVPVAATLSFSGRGRIVNLSTGRGVSARDGLSLKLDSYGFESFALEGASPIGMRGDDAPPEIIERYVRACREFRPIVEKLRPRVGTSDTFGGHASDMKRFVELADAADRAVSRGGIGKARLILDGGEWNVLAGIAKDLARPQYWGVIGPFDNQKRTGFDKVYPVERDIIAGKRPLAAYPCMLASDAHWREVLGETQGEARGHVDFLALFGQRSDFRVGYAVARVRAAKDFEGELWLGSDDALAIWINGEQVFRLMASRSASSASDKVRVKLRQGENTILLKLDNGVGGWAFYFDIRALDGREPEGLDFISPAVKTE